MICTASKSAESPKGGDSAATEENYSLYPNPLTKQSRLEFGNAKHERFVFTLYDITGRQIEHATTNGDHFIINKDAKQDGLYFFKLENEKTGEVENGKVVAQ